jgi:hypothetical protein
VVLLRLHLKVGFRILLEDLAKLVRLLSLALMGKKDVTEDTTPVATQETAAVQQQPAMIAESDTEAVLSEAARRQREADAQALLAEEDFMMEPIRLQEGGMVTGGKFDHKTNPIDIVQKGPQGWRDDWRRSDSQSSATARNSARRVLTSVTLLKKFNKQK